MQRFYYKSFETNVSGRRFQLERTSLKRSSISLKVEIDTASGATLLLSDWYLYWTLLYLGYYQWWSSHWLKSLIWDADFESSSLKSFKSKSDFNLSRLLVIQKIIHDFWIIRIFQLLTKFGFWEFSWKIIKKEAKLELVWHSSFSLLEPGKLALCFIPLDINWILSSG